MGKPLDPLFRRKPGTPKKRRKLPVAPAVGRLRVLLIVIAVGFSLTAGRAVQVQAIDASAVAAKAADQITVSHALPALRGDITDRNGEPIAITEDTVIVIASPKLIATNGRWNAQMTERDKAVAATAPDKIAALLVQFLGGSHGDYLAKLSKKESGYQVVARDVPSATYRSLSQAMSAAGLVGLSSESKPTRNYPNKTLAANVIGFVNGSGVGASGLEYLLNSQLSGTSGKEVYESSPKGEKIPMGTNILTPAVNGIDYQLTIDAGLQYQVEQLLANRVKKTQANSGSVIVTNPQTGEILALANYPTFDANQPGKTPVASLGNRAITDAYTPGSVQKTLTFAALMDQGLVNPTDVVTVPAKIRSGDYWVTDAWKHGTTKLYARGVLAKSSNVGTIKLARLSSKQSLHDYMVSFGLGAKTGLGLPGESAGSLPGVNMADDTRDGLAFGGNGVLVTMPQMAAAVGSLANGGVYNQPQIIKSRTLPNGTVEGMTSAAPRRVVSVDTASKVLSMMESMAEANSAHVFDVPGYRVGAKTGTSKKFNPKCNCYRGLVTSSISVAPVEAPRVLVYVVIDGPRRGASGAAVAGPLVQQVMSLSLARYAVPQSASKAPKLPIAP